MEEVKMNWLSDQNGNLLAPKTLIEAVQNAKGTSLEELLNSSSGLPEVYIGNEEPTEEGIEIFIDTSENVEEHYTVAFADTPIGTIISYMGNTAPKDYLICDGTEYEIAKYKDLAEHIKKEFGSYNYFGGDGVATFAVPDLRGEFLRGSGKNSHENGGSGANVGKHQTPTSFVPLATQDANLGNYIQHEFIENYDDNIPVTSTAWRYVGRSQNNYDDITAMSTWGSKTSRPTNTSVLYCIKYKVDKKSANIIPQHEYSTEEKVVGTWADGKPLYEITIDLGEWTLNSSLNYDATHLNIDEVIFIDASWHQINQPNYRGTISTTSGIDNRCLYFNGTYIKGASSSFTHRYITIQYTKTTD